MPLDSVTLSALTAELRGEIVSAKIDKVQQPERDTIILSLRGMGKNMRLVVCGGVGNARVHLTNEGYENPMHPPMFCMLLRKHLVGATISALHQPQRERIVIFELDAYDEMRTPVKKKLIVEMIGRGTNIILVDEEERIIDCLRRVDSETSPLRQILPGLKYRLQLNQTKPDFFAATDAERRALWSYYDGEKQPEQWILGAFSCLSPLLCREMVHRCRGVAENLPAAMSALADTVNAGEFTPYMLSRDGSPTDFSFMQISQYADEMQGERFDSFSLLLDAFFTRRSKAENMKRRTQSLRKNVKNAHERTVKKLALQEGELKNCAERETKRRYGDLLTASLYMKLEGQKSVTLPDFYEEACKEIQIPLDPLKTMQQNAAQYYKQYNKLKSAEEHLVTLIEEGRRDALYLASVLDELDRAQSESDIGEIRRELVETGYLKKSKIQKNAKKERQAQSAPLKYISGDGIEILVGRSNLQNDMLTLKTAHRGDMWLHTQKIHGSHVIIRCAGAVVSDETLFEAACLAALHSQAADGSKVPVDYTRVKYVKKTSGSLPGMVIYTDYSTIIASGDKSLADRLRA